MEQTDFGDSSISPTTHIITKLFAKLQSDC